VDSPSSQESVILSILLKQLERAKSILTKGNVKRNHVIGWSTLLKVRSKKYMGRAQISESLSPKLIPEGVNFGDELKKRMDL